MRKLIITMLAGLLAGCGGGSRYESFDNYEQVPLSAAERQIVIQDRQSVIGTRYTWGGDTIAEGFDCSGLIQWAFRQQGFGKFRHGDTVRDEITAHNLLQRRAGRQPGRPEAGRLPLLRRIRRWPHYP